MKRWDKVARMACVLALAALSVAPRLRAENAAAEPKTLEDQVTYFENALSDALIARDWKMLEMAAEGFRTVKLSGKDLEISVLCAERSAAWDCKNREIRAAVECWGLAARALSGNAEARKSLREWAVAELAPVNPPDTRDYDQNREKFKAAQKAFSAFAFSVQKRDQACLALALLKDPGIQKTALERVRTWKADRVLQALNGGGGFELVEAVLAAEPQAGWLELMALLNAPDEEVTSEAKLHLIGSLVALWKVRDVHVNVDSDIAALLPEGALMQFLKPYTMRVKNWKAENDKSSETLRTLINIALSLPLLPENSETLTELEALKSRMQGGSTHTIDLVLDKQKKNAKEPQGAVKPPKAPNNSDF